MNVKFLGTGGAFDVGYGNASMTIDMDQRILVDCGPSVYPTLISKGLMESIDLLLLTHLHGDHVGSLFQMVYYFRLFLNRHLTIGVATREFGDEVNVLLKAMNVSEGYYNLVPLEEIEGVESIETTGKHSRGVTSFAYVFRDDQSTVYYSGDLGDLDVTRAFLDSADHKDLTVFHEMSHAPSSAHVHYSKLGELLERARIYAYHLDPEKIPEDNRVPLVQDHPELLW